MVGETLDQEQFVQKLCMVLVSWSIREVQLIFIIDSLHCFAA